VPADDDRDLRAARLAGRRHGVVTYDQLRELGFSRGAIRHRVARGRLHPVHRLVYALGHPALTPDGVRYAAVVACGTSARASHRMAAALWGLRAYRLLEVTAPTTRRAPRGVVLHATNAFDPDDETLIRAIPATSLARTLVDLAEVETVDRLSRIIDHAGRLDAFDLRRVEATAARLSGRRGIPTLRAALGLPSPGLTRSELEDAFVLLCRTHDLPLPRTNHAVAGPDRLYEADAWFADHRLIVELDSGLHDNVTAFHADRRRDAALATAGVQTVRLTEDRVVHEPVAVAAEPAGILRAREG
jgi:hypothetical protein